jgi:hypothetical protein
MHNLTPRLIKAAASKILGIEQGWYGVKVSGTIMTGPSSTLEKCLETIGLLPEPVVKRFALPGDTVSTRNADESASSSMQTVSLYKIGRKPSRTLGEG